MRQSYKTVLLWVVLIVMFVSFYQFFNHNGTEVKETEYSTYLTQVEKQQVEQVAIKGNTHTYTLKGDKTEYKTSGPVGEKLIERLDGAAVKFKFEKEEQNSVWLQVLLQGLPIVFLFVVFLLFMRQLQGSGGKAMSFGKSKAKLLSEVSNKITFNDVAGIDECKDELEEIVSFLKDPKKYTRLGGRIPKGVLLMGPPGTGKTLLARSVAGEAGVPFFSISGSDFVEMFVGVGASRVRDLFEQGKKNAPCIIFIDEIDAVGRHRGAGLGGGHDEREQTLNQLLVEMDGFESNEGVILIAATNRPDVLDPALLRPGRFDRRIVVPRPDVKGREGILKVHTKKTPLSPEVDLEIIARGTPGFSGADLENLVNEAALLAARQNKDRVDMTDFESAKDKVIMGTERRSLVMSEKEKYTTAVHEAGHALVAKLLPGTDPVHKVTIIPRGRALGLTQQLPVEDRLNISREYALGAISVLMGGRIAEELVLNGQKTTGAGNDIERATDMARSMVCEWGMTALGPMTFGKKQGEVFLGRDGMGGGHSADYSEQTARDIDAEVRKIVTEQYDLARKVLEENLSFLLAMADALMEHETIDGEDINVIMGGGKITRARPNTAVLANRPAATAGEKKDKKNILDALEGLGKTAEPGKA
ncbi:ATP-dependent zinc metalloprotease FtsH [Vulgatibacter sp.]|uniref:ATP-dependent zinc metalloprotease FtsH n=1 Tax=Vulgatibacter sp. TaxID=1971226 RepID=UPI003564E8C3